MKSPWFRMAQVLIIAVSIMSITSLYTEATAFTPDGSALSELIAVPLVI